MQPGRRHHHRLCTPSHAVHHLAAKVLDDDLGLLGQVVLVQLDEAGELDV